MSEMIGIYSVTRRLMIPLTLLIVLCTLGAGILFYQQYRHRLHDSSMKNTNELMYSMDILIQEQTVGLQLAIIPIANDPMVIKALQHRDAHKLLIQWQNVFELMKKQTHLSHFYFMDKNRVCLLRVHKSTKYGDVINRFTAREAQWSRKVSSGIEVGPMGTLTLRVVYPVLVDNEIIGYVELGKEIEDVLEHLHEQPNTHLAMVLKKTYLNRTQWEEGMQILGREANWDMLKNDVLIYSSLSNLPLPLLEGNHFIDNNEFRHLIQDNEYFLEGKTFTTSAIPFKDVSGKEIGNLVLINDITVENVEFFDFIAASGLIGFAIIGLLSGSMYFILRRIDCEIADQQTTINESKNRLEQLAHHSRTIAWEVDASGKYTYMSDVVYEVLGYTSQELIGKYFYDLHPIEGREEFRRGAFEIFTRKECFTNLKNQAVTKTEDLVWLMTNGLPIIGDNGKLLGYRGSDTDITQWEIVSMERTRNLIRGRMDEEPQN